MDLFVILYIAQINPVYKRPGTQQTTNVGIITLTPSHRQIELVYHNRGLFYNRK